LKGILEGRSEGNGGMLAFWFHFDWAPRRHRVPAAPACAVLHRACTRLTTPGHPQQCCTRQTITVPPDVLAKTAQKHDYPSAAHRRSYARRTGAERSFSTAKDPASNTIARGWCRLMGRHFGRAPGDLPRRPGRPRPVSAAVLRLVTGTVPSSQAGVESSVVCNPVASRA
jgi:hypothetical protein